MDKTIKIKVDDFNKSLAEIGNLSDIEVKREVLENGIDNLHIEDIFFDKESLDNCIFSDCIFFRCSFIEASLEHVAFNNCRFEECSFSAARFSHSIFDNCYIDGIFSAANFSFSKLNNCVIENSDFTGAVLIGANIERCEIRKSNFSYSNFRNCSISQNNYIETDCVFMDAILLDKMYLAGKVDALEKFYESAAKVLVVEDEIATMNEHITIVKKVCSRSSYGKINPIIYYVENAQEANIKLQKNPFDLILIDACLPKTINEVSKSKVGTELAVSVVNNEYEFNCGKVVFLISFHEDTISSVGESYPDLPVIKKDDNVNFVKQLTNHSKKFMKRINEPQYVLE